MNIRIQIIIGVIVIFALCIIVNMIREKKLELRYALAWLGVWNCNFSFRLFSTSNNLVSYKSRHS